MAILTFKINVFTDDYYSAKETPVRGWELYSPEGDFLTFLYDDGTGVDVAEHARNYVAFQSMNISSVEAYVTHIAGSIENMEHQIATLQRNIKKEQTLKAMAQGRKNALSK